MWNYPLRNRVGNVGRRATLLLLFACIVGPTTASAQFNIDWIRQFGTAYNDGGSAAAIDGAGNLLIGGGTLGSFAGVSAGDSDGVILSLHPLSGDLRWTAQIGSPGADSISGIAVDGIGNVYAAGVTDGNLAATNAGFRDGFVAKFSDTGDMLWQRQFGGAGSDIVWDIAADAFGNSYSIGYVSTLNDLTGFIAKHDTDGNLLWIREHGTPYYDEARSVALSIRPAISFSPVGPVGSWARMVRRQLDWMPTSANSTVPVICFGRSNSAAMA